jgi:hypothetical protein
VLVAIQGLVGSSGPGDPHATRGHEGTGEKDRLISDIYLDGVISEVATRRSEFAAILRNEWIDGLIAALNPNANMLTGTTAKAF